MKSLSEMLTDTLVEQLKIKTARGDFPGIDLKTAMNFLLTDGVVPQSGLLVSSFIHLEDWVRDFNRKHISFTATELKNKTGWILEQVTSGKVVTIYRHKRPIAQICPIDRMS